MSDFEKMIGAALQARPEHRPAFNLAAAAIARVQKRNAQLKLVRRWHWLNVIVGNVACIVFALVIGWGALKYWADSSVQASETVVAQESSSSSTNNDDSELLYAGGFLFVLALSGVAVIKN